MKHSDVLTTDHLGPAAKPVDLPLFAAAYEKALEKLGAEGEAFVEHDREGEPCSIHVTGESAHWQDEEAFGRFLELAIEGHYGAW